LEHSGSESEPPWECGEAKTWEPMEWPDPITEHSENSGDGVTALSCRKCGACYAKAAFANWAFFGELPAPTEPEYAELAWFKEQVFLASSYRVHRDSAES
jgi:hypothetical protein